MKTKEKQTAICEFEFDAVVHDADDTEALEAILGEVASEIGAAQEDCDDVPPVSVRLTGQLFAGDLLNES